MKKILLIDVDSKIPNLALMKLSTYYKKKKYEVEIKKLKYTGYPMKRKYTLIDGSDYDKIFVSIIFVPNKEIVRIINCKSVYFGGSGYDVTVKLPQEIDDMEEDYTLYPENNKSWGFITRGCIRKCYFCFVPKKEGLIHRYREVDQIVKHKKIDLMDNNILAFKDSEKILQELIDKKINCHFNQGLDIRLVTEKKAELLSKLTYYGEYIFAFDQLKDKELIEMKLKVVRKYITGDWRIKMYIYCHPSNPIQEDVIWRINWCRENKILPYLMRDQECWDSENKEFYIDLAAYSNQPSIFKKMDFETFLLKRHSNKDRMIKSFKIYSGKVLSIDEIDRKIIKIKKRDNKKKSNLSKIKNKL